MKLLGFTFLPRLLLASPSGHSDAAMPPASANRGKEDIP
jgi:hypothetical protein